MNIILLSGGSGKRLWPLSNDVRSKQFIKLFKNNDEYESMVQRVYRQITTVEANAKITIATSKSQASIIRQYIDWMERFISIQMDMSGCVLSGLIRSESTGKYLSR